MSKKRQENVKVSKKQRRKRKKKLRLLLIVELLLIVILVPVAFGIIQLSKIKTSTTDLSNVTVNSFNDPNMSDYLNLVVYGVDSRANELDKNTRSDSIIIVSINKKTKHIKLSSIYRDTYVNIDGHGYTKVNHAYSYGGPALSIDTLNQNLDLNLQDFVTVNFSALTNVIDLLGGIELDIQENELDYVNAYTRDVAKINGMDFEYIKKTGKQTVTGVQATGYCRVRYTKGGDFTRAQRQRTVMEAILKKAKKANPVTLYKVADEILPQIYTSMSTGELIKLGAGLPFYKIDEQTGFPFDNTPKTINGADVIVATTLSGNVTKLHEFLFGTKDFKPSKTVQSISNSIG